MSLDITLRMDDAPPAKINEDVIYLRRDGRAVRISRQDWEEIDRSGIEPVTLCAPRGVVYHGNITHNLTTMAERAGLYRAMWRPAEVNARVAADMIPNLEAGIVRLEADPDRFREFTPPNKWGSYETLLTVAKEYLAACRQYPDAIIEVDR